MFYSVSNWFSENPYSILLYFGILAGSAALWSTGKIGFEDDRTEN